MQAFENALREKCRFNGAQPYWNWSLHTENFYNSDPIFDPSPTSGLGTNGDLENDWHITDGALAHDFFLSYPNYHPNRRNFTLKPWFNMASQFTDNEPNLGDPNKLSNTTFDKAEVKKLVEGYEGNFTGFQQEFEWIQVNMLECFSVIFC